MMITLDAGFYTTGKLLVRSNVKTVKKCGWLCADGMARGMEKGRVEEGVSLFRHAWFRYYDEIKLIFVNSCALFWIKMCWGVGCYVFYPYICSACCGMHIMTWEYAWRKLFTPYYIYHPGRKTEETSSRWTGNMIQKHECNVYYV